MFVSSTVGAAVFAIASAGMMVFGAWDSISGLFLMVLYVAAAYCVLNGLFLGVMAVIAGDEVN